MKDKLTNAKEFIACELWCYTKYCLVGASGAILDIGLFTLLSRSFGIDRYIAATMAISVAIISNFIWNRFWTFQSKDPNVKKQFTKFVTVSLGALGLNLIFLYLFTGLFELLLSMPADTFPLWADIMAKILATMVVSFYNFGSNRFWTFK